MNPIALRGLYGVGEIAGPSRYAASPFSPVGAERTLPGFPYGMRGMAGLGNGNGYPPAPVPQGLPAQSYWQLPPYFTHTYGYKDALAAAGMEFHTEIFDLGVDPVAQSGAAIPIGGSVIATVRISQEADFVGEKYVSDTFPLGSQYTVQIFDNATNRALSNIPLRVSNIAGTAQRPRILKPRLFRRNSDISFLFTNIDTVPITALQFVIEGYKIFDPNALNLNNPQ
jgi:hypothetical protein